MRSCAGAPDHAPPTCWPTANALPPCAPTTLAHSMAWWPIVAGLPVTPANTCSHRPLQRLPKRLGAGPTAARRVPGGSLGPLARLRAPGADRRHGPSAQPLDYLGLNFTTARPWSQHRPDSFTWVHPEALNARPWTGGLPPGLQDILEQFAATTPSCRRSPSSRRTAAPA